ncbi:DNA/RNA non-specific endonuclease [Butyrivibrio sp. LC3010]|uniref:DNA/RNA non-specific endonuclease n=1 Tax=Butyrivibrio sp. LC3010 TaxID=1280680 RepID=UPI0009DB968B|nr:DNA/RNA non-specific endonuclease [Butyrivibrio sp. LC3010]
MLLDITNISEVWSTAYQYHNWDSKREYDRFWGKDKKRKKRRNFLVFLLIVLVVGVLLFVLMNKLSQRNTRSLGQNAETFSMSLVESDETIIPEYSGEIYVELNGNMPCFNEYDLLNVSGETYSELDKFGRCGTAIAMLDRTMMPTEERGSIGQIRPSGWNQEKYPGLVDSDPPYLYNRCHLIAYALTGQNANELNLITGTRYFNVEGMLPFEEQVMRYLDNSDNHVLYRITPYFKDKELLARGVEMEAYSVEDNGAAICFHVFVYNVQPGIVLDYKTGESEIE